MYAIGRIRESLVYMHKALNCEPSTKVAAVNLNKIYNDRITKNPNDIEAYIGWADVLSHIDRKSESASYYVSSANLLVDAGEKELAKGLYKKAIEAMPSNCEANFMYGTMLMDDDMLREAAPYLLASSHGNNCSRTFVLSIGRLNYIYQKVIDTANGGNELLMDINELRTIGERLADVANDPKFEEAKEKVLKEVSARSENVKKKEDKKEKKKEEKKKDILDMSTLGTSDEGYVLVEDDDDDDEPIYV